MEDLVKLEKELHEPTVRKNRKRLDQLLHDSFTEIGRSGVLFDKNQIMSSLSSESSHSVWSQDYTTQTIDDELVLLTYRSAHVEANMTLSRFSRRASLWRLTGLGWQMIYHQGTPTDAFDREAT